jgi:hypothetical protein
LHDVLVWLSTTLRLAHASAEGRRLRDAAGRE